MSDTEQGYTVGAIEAAQILGVSVTRLSQLTSKGVFSFERRKLDTRNRLYYSRNELLSYMRSRLGIPQQQTKDGQKEKDLFQEPLPHHHAPNQTHSDNKNVFDFTEVRVVHEKKIKRSHSFVSAVRCYDELDKQTLLQQAQVHAEDQFQILIRNQQKLLNLLLDFEQKLAFLGAHFDKEILTIKKNLLMASKNSCSPALVDKILDKNKKNPTAKIIVFRNSSRKCKKNKKSSM